MASRDLMALDSRIRRDALAVSTAWAAAGLDVLVTCTYRSNEEQARLYEQGRTMPGRIVTYAKPGESMHNLGLALDFVPVVSGRLVWDDQSPLWEMIARIAMKVDDRIVWGGFWSPKKRDMPHLEWSLGNLGSKPGFVPPTV